MTTLRHPLPTDLSRFRGKMQSQLSFTVRKCHICTRLMKILRVINQTSVEIIKRQGISVGILKKVKSFWEKPWPGTVPARATSTAWQPVRRANRWSLGRVITTRQCITALMAPDLYKSTWFELNHLNIYEHEVKT